ncbi:MAG: ORF6N domain-containing protein [Candidatus Bipolaricaulis sp.]|nr:ORF6N domain-containing protein [Candidatus Bipolaricaulis sp.]
MLQRLSEESILLPIAEVRGIKVILDSDLADLLGATTQALNQAVKRNPERFPAEFVFQLTPREFAGLRSRSATSDRGGRRRLPFAFTEHGVLMAATVLNSPQAIGMSVFVVRAFIRLRSIYASHIELTRRLDELDVRVGAQDESIRAIVEAIRRLMFPDAPPKALVGLCTLERWSGRERPE